MYDFWKNRKSKTSRDQKLCKFFFPLWGHFDKLLKLGQISGVILYYIEIKDSLYQGTFFVYILKNWYKMKKIIA